MTVDSEIARIKEAQALLRKFICIEQIPPEDVPVKTVIQEALLIVRENSDYQILGICADTADDAIAALHAYLNALDYPVIPTPAPIEGAVYLKFNPKTGFCHLDAYVGTHRGVLVSSGICHWICLISH